MKLFVALCVCASFAAGQNTAPAKGRAREPVETRTREGEDGSWIFGTVVSDLTGRPLHRASVILKPVSAQGNGLVAETDDHGRFTMSRIAPGTYSLSAQRDGYLVSAAPRRGSLRLPPLITLSGTTRVRDLVFRLRPWSVISGRIRYDDGEPAVGAVVQLYRESVDRGRHMVRQMATARVNDRGEYRMHGLSPGPYFIAATRTRPVSATDEEQETLDEQGRVLGDFRYATTFYPSAQKLEDAVVVRLQPAGEVDGIDIDLKPVPSVPVRGRVTNGITGETLFPPALEFRRITADGRASIGVPVNIRAYRDRGEFEIRGITAGPYTIVANTDYQGRKLTARRTLLVTNAPVDSLDFVLEADVEMRGQVRFETDSQAPLANLRIQLEPRSDLTNTVAAYAEGGGRFAFRLNPAERYDVYVQNLPAGVFVKSARVGNLDIQKDGLQATSEMLEITLSDAGATIWGRVLMSDGAPAGGIQVVAVPDPLPGRLSQVGRTDATEYGVFGMKSLAPGRYTVFAYYDEPLCNFWDEAELVTCRGLGRSVEVSESGSATIEIRVP